MGRYRHSSTSALHSATSRRVAMNKYFPGIGRIEYHPDAGPEETLVFRHYNAGETVHGRTMEEWMKFSVCYFNTFRYLGDDNHYGERCMQRSWEDGTQSLDNYKRRMLASFELLQKLDVKYYSLSDRDVAPEGDSFDETNRYLNEMVTLACDLQRYSSFNSEFGEKVDNGEASFEDCEEFVKKAGEPEPQSSRHEHYENMFNYYVYPQQQQQQQQS